MEIKGKVQNKGKKNPLFCIFAQLRIMIPTYNNCKHYCEG